MAARGPLAVNWRAHTHHVPYLGGCAHTAKPALMELHSVIEHCMVANQARDEAEIDNVKQGIVVEHV